MRPRPLKTSRLLLAAAYGLGGVFAYVACTPPPPVGVIPTVIQPGTTSVSVDPSAFLGAVACSTLPGGMQSYVATVTDSSAHFALESSPPTACSQSTYFEDIVVGDAFTAEVDGYEQPADELVPTCGAPAPNAPPSCTKDSECPSAYGCQGRCLVSLFVNEDFSCLQGCLFATDAGAPTSQQVAAFAKCVSETDTLDGGVGNCASSSLAGYEGCVQGCEIEALGGSPNDTNAGDFVACVQSANDCLLSDIPVLQTECTTVPSRQVGGIPAGGVPDGGVAGGGDLVLGGEVQTCTCFYPVAEGSRQMYSRTTRKPVFPRWTTSTQGAVCGQQLVIGSTQRTCTKDADCPAVGGFMDSCSQGFCTPKKPRPCFSDEDCPPGRLCDDPTAVNGSYCEPTAVAYTNTSITPCSVEDSESDAGVTSIQVVAGALLSSSPTEQPGAPVCVAGELPDGGKSVCNDVVPDGGTGTVTAFDIVPADPTISSTAQTTGLGCCIPTVTEGLTFTQGLVPNRSYAFTVLAFDGAGTPAYSACCFATARAGVEVTAMCDPLAPVGIGGVPPCQ